MKAVIFDLDGVVTDSAKCHYKAWKILADKLEIDFDEKFNEKLKGISRLESLDLILKHGNKEKAYTIDAKELMAEEKNQNYRKFISKMTSDDILPGIRPFLEDLKSKGIKTALASVSKNASYIVKHLDLVDYFDYIANANDIQRSKPFPDIYLDCAKALKVSPRECIGIEDARAGVLAIKAANMKAIGIGLVEQLKEADLILDSTVLLSLDLLLNTFDM